MIEASVRHLSVSDQRYTSPMRQTIKWLAQLSLIASTVAVMTGCGNKGDLYLPEPVLEQAIEASDQAPSPNTEDGDDRGDGLRSA